MALHTQLPIYKVAYDLLDIVTDLVKNMPRDYKQAIGSELRDQCLQMSLLVPRANIAQTKEPHLAGIIERKETLELLIRLSCDLRLISRAQYAGAKPIYDEEPAVSPAPTFADGMTAEDDRRFLELTNDLTHNYGGNARE